MGDSPKSQSKFNAQRAQGKRSPRSQADVQMICDNRSEIHVWRSGEGGYGIMHARPSLPLYDMDTFST